MRLSQRIMMILNTNKNNTDSTNNIEDLKKDLKNNMDSTNNIEDLKKDLKNNMDYTTNNIEDPNKNIEDPSKNIEDPNKNKKNTFSEGVYCVIFAIVYTEFVEFF